MADSSILVGDVKDSIAGGFAVANPDWEGALSPGIEFLRSNTNPVFVIAVRHQ